MGAVDDLRSPATAAMPSAAPSSSPWKRPAPQATPFTPSSSPDKKSVFLSDWWLIEVERGSQGKGLAVGGFTTRKHATRVFNSAAIVKRNDAYTLETADGVIVIIQGMINKARTQDNGFPLEVCNYFLIGFPYNWSYYADEYFKKKSASSSPRKQSSLDVASKDSTGKTGSTFPLHLDEFPIGMALSILTSGGDNLRTNFSDHMKKFFKSASADSKMQESPSLPMDDLGKHNMDKRDENIIESAITVKHGADGHSVYCSEQIGCSRNNLNEGNAYSMLGEQERVGMQKKTLFTNIREMETDNRLVPCISVNHGDIARMQYSIEGKLDAEDLNNLMGEGSKEALQSPLIEASYDSHKEQGDDAVGRQNCSDKSLLYNADVTDIFIVPSCSESKNADSLKEKIDDTLENSPHSNVIESLNARTWQEKSVRTGYFGGEVSTGNIAEFSSDEINGMCHSIIENISNCSISVENPTARICSPVDFKLTRESEVDFGSQKEILIKVVGKRGTNKNRTQKQNQKCTERIGLRDCISTSAAKGPQDEDKLTSKSTLPGAERQLSTVDVHNNPSLIGICTRSGCKLSSPSIFSRSECLKDKSVSSSKTKAKKVIKKQEAENTRLETSENVQNHLNFKEKWLTSFSEDHSVSSYATTKELQKQSGLATDHIDMENSHESGSPKFSAKIIARSDISVMVVSSKDKSLDISGKESLKKMNNQDLEEPEVAVAEKPEEPNKNKRLHVYRRRKMRRQTSFVQQQSPLTRDKAKKLSLALPESLNLRRSRSGRLIVPHLDYGCQQIIYDAFLLHGHFGPQPDMVGDQYAVCHRMDGSITGIMGVDLLRSPIQAPLRSKELTKQIAHLNQKQVRVCKKEKNSMNTNIGM